jgi:hypothetical protein
VAISVATILLSGLSKTNPKGAIRGATGERSRGHTIGRCARHPGHTDVSVRVGHPASTPGHAGHCPVDVRASCVAHRSLHFFVDERMTRFTSETDTPNVRAMVGAFRPASNDARIRFAFPSGISATSVRSIRDGIGRAALGADPSSVLPVEVPRFPPRPQPAAVEVPSLPDIGARLRDRGAKQTPVRAFSFEFPCAVAQHIDELTDGVKGASMSDM